REEARDIVVETDLYRLVLSTRGARLRSFQLKEYEEVEVKREVWERELRRIETALEREKKAGAKERLTRERDRLKYLIEKDFLPDEEREFTPLELVPFCGDHPLTIHFPAIDEKGELNFALYQPSLEGLKLGEGKESGTIEFRYVTAEGVEIERKFRFSRGSYLIGLEISIRNNSPRAIIEDSFLIAYGPGIGLVEEAPQRGQQISHFASWVRGRLKRDRAGREVGEGFFRPATMKWGEPLFHPGPLGWTAMRNHYFAAALIPGEEVAGAELLEKEDGRRWIALKMPPFSLPPGGEASKSLSLYLGPQDMEVLRQSSPGLEMIVDFGFWSMIARPIHALLRVFYRWFGNYGVSIILLSLMIKLAFYPFTRKSFEAMKSMQEDMKALQPEIEALKKKYKNNPQKLQKATMELYKKRGVNPLSGCKGGCLPMLFQMPVFFALFAVLNSAIELRRAPFFAWIDDLSSRDPYYILPLLMGVTMYFQQKVTGMGGAGGAQPEQAKMMGIMMPVILTFVFFNLPSGVVLYWLCFNVFTSLQQLLVKKKPGAEGKA
ncbi:membrane protein insertase YidC, partial [candidate division NPL-UPA2 bacterium]|nr:membrane protein insertase YidC [candidate division NPL-UPA2 bacterium]